MKNTDLIHGSIMKSIIVFSIPLFISYLFQTFYNTADTFIIGRFLGDTSLAAIGSVGAIYELLIGFANGIGTGLTLVASRYFGSGDKTAQKISCRYFDDWFLFCDSHCVFRLCFN